MITCDAYLRDKRLVREKLKATDKINFRSLLLHTLSIFFMERERYFIGKHLSINQKSPSLLSSLQVHELHPVWFSHLCFLDFSARIGSYLSLQNRLWFRYGHC